MRQSISIRTLFLCLPLDSYSEEGSDCELVDPKREMKRVNINVRCQNKSIISIRSLFLCLPLEEDSEEGSDYEMVDPKREIKRVLDVGCCYHYHKTQD